MSDIKEIAKQVDSIKSTIGGLQNQLPLQSSPLNYFYASDEEYKLYTLQRLEKENHALQLAEESLNISKKSAQYGKIAALLAGIGILTTIVIAILTFMFS